MSARVFSRPEGGSLTKIRDMEQVLDVAARLFGERGFDETRLEDIAEELGVLKGSLYYYIDSKRQLLLEVNKRRLVQRAERAAEVAGSEGSPIEKLDVILREHMRSIDRFYPESSQWFAAISARPEGDDTGDEVTRLHRQYAGTIRGLVAEGQAAGLIRPELDASVATMTLLGACNWLTFWYRRGGSLGIEDVAENILDLLVEGLRLPGDEGGPTL